MKDRKTKGLQKRYFLFVWRSDVCSGFFFFQNENEDLVEPCYYEMRFKHTVFREENPVLKWADQKQVFEQRFQDK